MTTPEQSMIGYLAEPEGEPRGAVIVIHEIWGLVPHIQDIADRFAAEGFLAVAPDLLSDAGVTPEIGLELMAARNDPDEERRTAAQPRLREALGAANAPEYAAAAVQKLRAIVDELVDSPGVDGRVAVVGFCFGGSYAFSLAAADDRVRAAVPFYGSAPDAATLADLRCPVLAIYGAHDERLMADLPRIREDVAAADLDFTDVVYPDAGHAFFNDTNASAYRAPEARDAWARTIAFLDERLVG